MAVRTLFVTISALSIGAVGVAFALAGKPAKLVTVTVTATDFRFRLSRQRVPTGPVRFVVVNRGATEHDFAVAGRRTPVLKPGARAVLTVRLGKPGRYRYLCTIAGHAALGMKGSLAAGSKGAPTPPPSTTTAQQPPPPPPPSGAPASLTQVGSFNRPVYVTAPPGDEHRLFVVEQKGTIRMLVDGELQPVPFLDLSDRVMEDNENGLLSMAFAPDYEASGLVYVYFNAREANGNVKVMEFRRSARNPNLADPESERLVLSIVKPWANHNGGMMEFGPDGYLYIAVGDGDSGVLHPPGAFAQTLDDLLGNILRIEPRQSGDEPYSVPDSNPFVGVGGARPEIWAYGLRNPWRFWVDDVAGDLYVGDVGEGNAEEIDHEPGGVGGYNFGWPCFEGTVPFDPTARCEGAVPPLLSYAHAPNACSVIGGVVLRDPRLEALNGVFLYTDLCGGALKALRVAKGDEPLVSDLGVVVSEPTSFGEDALGRAYVTTLGGAVYRIDPASP